MELHKLEERKVVERKAISFEEFKEILFEHKPKNIYNTQYSTTTPCWSITEYLDNDRIKYFATSWADKSPVEESLHSVYTSWLIQGLIYCHF